MATIFCFYTLGGGSHGQGPGLVGGVVLDRAGVVIELPAGHALVNVFRKHPGLREVEEREVADVEVPAAPELSDADKQVQFLEDMEGQLGGMHMAYIRRIAGKQSDDKNTKDVLITGIMGKLRQGDDETFELLEAELAREDGNA